VKKIGLTFLAHPVLVGSELSSRSIHKYFNLQY